MHPTYLNTAATGILPQEFTITANKLYADLSANSSQYAEQWRDEKMPIIRKSVADFISAIDKNLVFVPNFSWGITGIVHTLRGDEKVLMYAADYPSLIDPFKINNFDITWVSDDDGFTIPVDEIKQKLLSEQIQVLAISHVQWMSGYKLDLVDLGSFCKENNICFIVDATQSLGAIPIDVAEMNIDVFISSTYKWMNAGFGTGIMYVSDDFLKRYTPKVCGNNSYIMQDGKAMYIPGAISYEPGHPNMYGLSLLAEAVKDKTKRGVDNIEQFNRKLTQLLLDNIRELKSVTLIGDDSTDNRASIVFLKDENGLWEKLQEHNIICSQRGNIRISMHYYNTEDDVMKLVDVLKMIK